MPVGVVALVFEVVSAIVDEEEEESAERETGKGNGLGWDGLGWGYGRGEAVIYTCSGPDGSGVALEIPHLTTQLE
ncbi:hypothetical protein FRC19_001746 [Serendipita sp. 401]|nr:hypothetical protein FRC19_001746 [Serendipita sp. 401]